MRIVTLSLCALVLASCARASEALLPGQPSLDHVRPLSGSGFDSIYSFQGAPDGAAPDADVVNVHGAFYGTTSKGGANACACGTVFAIDPSGSERVVYSFAGGRDGANPQAGLVVHDGKLYGTTEQGGMGPSGGNGTVFEVTSAGKERVLYRFKGGKDGANPYAALTFFHGAFYGTTYSGGTKDDGVIFKITPSGSEATLYRFKNSPDGRGPLGGLIAVGNTLYGTTAGGGTHIRGTVYTSGASGDERVIYNFKGHKDGEIPSTTLVLFGSTLYGTTVYGGGPSSISDGTVFGITLAGKEHVVYRFQGSPDGASPYGNLTVVRGKLYGTTYFGGQGPPSQHGFGTVYELTTAGRETILHSFTGGAGGGNPAAGMIAVDGTLYGTSSGAGLSYSNGEGPSSR